jgi:CRISPR system Cascade subunit CasE
MAALKAISKHDRAEARKEIVRHEGLAWFRRQGVAAGFNFEDGGVAVDGCEPLTIRGNGQSAVRLSVIEFDGMLTVREPDMFLAHVARGFGRGKAFGLGLMLVRRPPS